MSANTISPAESQFLDWARQVAEGKNPYSLAPEEKIKEMYALAYFLYGQLHYLDASHLFRLLAAAQPSEPKYWKGLGACLQMLKDYDSALNCYASAQLLNRSQTDPYLYLHSADCFIALKEVKNAFKALDAAHKRAEKTKDKRVLSHVKLMRELWSINNK
jgi:secretion system chaperone SscA